MNFLVSWDNLCIMWWVHDGVPTWVKTNNFSINATRIQEMPQWQHIFMKDTVTPWLTSSEMPQEKGSVPILMRISCDASIDCLCQPTGMHICISWTITDVLLKQCQSKHLNMCPSGTGSYRCHSNSVELRSLITTQLDGSWTHSTTMTSLPDNVEYMRCTIISTTSAPHSDLCFRGWGKGKGSLTCDAWQASPNWWISCGTHARWIEEKMGSGRFKWHY